MAGRSSLHKWISEFCAPVVITVCSAEAERVSLQNGLLFHELLSAFGSLDGINAAVRTNGQVFGLADAHIRFERASEVDQKSGDQIEDLLHDSFEEFDINRLPNSLVELKAGPPSAWTELIRQIVIRSISFSEYEMLSHPVVILSVIATSDVDHIACMQELVSGHHSPAGIKNGLYDPTVLRQYIVLEDVAESSGNGLAILHQLQSVFPPNSTKLIRLNSFPANAPHLDQPDMWSKFLFPKFFPQRVPSDKPNLPRNPTTNNVVYGGRLTVEDFMNLRNFCINLFNQEIVPCLERRLNFLNKTVSDTRKGMKNVLNRFWRKPKEEYETKTGGVRYKYDKIESQILLLADTSFIIRDYQTALSTYKLVRDDFKSDKSLMHLAHVTIMIALCTLLMDATKAKDLPSLLEDLQNILCPTLDQPHGNAYFAVMAAEMYFYHYPHRLPLEAAKILLQASANIVRYPLLSGLLMEKAASCFLNAGHTRRFVFHEVLAGNRIHKFGARPAKHAAVCFAVSMLFLDQGHWGDLKTKMSHSLALDMKNSNKDLAQRSLLLMLRILTSILDDNAEVGNRTTSIRDALSVYNDLIAENIWGSVVVRDEWFNMTTRDLLLNSLPISPYDNTISGDILSTSTIIHGLPIPYVDQSTVSLLRPVNGLAKYEEAVVPSEDLATADQMVTMLELEANWLSSQKGNVHKTSEPNTRLSDVWADTMAELKKKDRKSAVKEKFYLALGEHINLSFTMQNKLPVDITAKQCRLHFSDTDSFEILPKDLIIPQNSKNKIQLAALPKKMGQFRVESTFWNLSEHLTVCCKLQRTGELLQKTIRQRANRERVVDRSLHFEVLQPHPLLTLSFEGLSPEVLQGQLLRTTLSLRNDGFARACNISIKLSQPSLILYCNSSEAVAQGQPMGIIPFTGSSSTVIQLNENLVIHPGSQIQLEAWLRITKSGDQKISLLASYMAQGEDGRQDCFFPDGSKRTSFISITTRGLPSFGVGLRMIQNSREHEKFSMITEVSNFLRGKSVEEMWKTGYNRLSSAGQLDMVFDFSNNEYLEVDDKCLRVVGLWLLGAAAPIAPLIPKVETFDDSSHAFELLASPGERVVGCYPIRRVEVTSTSSLNEFDGYQWLIPFSESDKLSLSGSTQLHLTEIIEHFLCVSTIREEFDREVNESVRMLELAELEAETLGPRSISQVRRENLKEKNEAIQSNLDEKLPSNSKEIAFTEAKKHAMTAVFVWVCRWEGKIRWGVHFLSHNTFTSRSTKEILKSKATNSRTVDMAEKVLVSIDHTTRIKLQKSSERSVDSTNKDLPIIIPVKVKIKSVYTENIFVNVRVTDVKDIVKLDWTGAYSFDSTVTLKPLTNKGVRWEGKTQYENVLVRPEEEIVLPFNAIITQFGVYDLNRFTVEIRNAIVATNSKASSEARWIQRLVPLQSIVEVIDGEVTSI